MYNEQPSALRNFWENTTPTQKVALFAIPFCMLVIVVIAVVSLTSRDTVPEEAKHIEITNFGEYSKAPEEYKLLAQQLLWETIVRFDGVSEEVHATGAIREGSATEYKAYADSEVFLTKFLVDIESLQQTYEVSYSWLENPQDYDDEDFDYEVFVDCPMYYDVIYKKTRCKASDNPYDMVARYLPYQSTTKNDTKIRLARESDEEGEYIAALINICGDEARLKEADSFTESWLEERLLDPEDYRVVAMSICENTEPETEGEIDYGWAESLLDY